MGRKGTGVEIREHSLRVGFMLHGRWTRETLRLAPTPKNIRHAEQMVVRINSAIANGTFDYGAFFPQSKSAPKAASNTTFGRACDDWLKTKGRLATKTVTQYRNALEVWKGLLGDSTPLDQLTHGKVAGVVGSHPWASAKLLNNYLICLRGVFALAGRDIKMDNPMDGIENSKAQPPGPDPLTKKEVERVLWYMRERFSHRVWAYFAFAFATGMRPEEIIALRWSDVDAKHNSIRVERARSAGEIKPLKTYEARDVDLTIAASLALKHLVSMDRPHPEIFINPVTGNPWHDERSQRDHYWRPALQALGIRERRAYCTRHTYAATALMGGVKPAYIALRRWKLARGIGLDEFIRADDPAWREMQEATSAARTQLKRAKMDAFNALRRMERVARMAGRLNRPPSW